MSLKATGRPHGQPRRWPAPCAALALALACASHDAQADAKQAKAPLPLMAAPRATDRVLVIAPHPDDETLCCGGYLRQAVAAGATVGVVWITAGDSFEIDAIVTERTLRPKGAGLEKLGVRRISEGHAAADRLGVPRVQQVLLGFPDRDLQTLLHEPLLAPLRSRYTGAYAVPYAEALHPGSPYTGAELRRNLQESLARFAPTIVLVAAPQDKHPDHSASGQLTVELLRASLPKARVYYWIVHGGREWPSPRGLHRERASQPSRLASSLSWERRPLSDADAAEKLAALGEHRSQMMVMRRFLESFVRNDEIFAPAP